jgi:hypothetical protein
MLSNLNRARQNRLGQNKSRLNPVAVDYLVHSRDETCAPSIAAGLDNRNIGMSANDRMTGLSLQKAVEFHAGDPRTA